MRVEGALFHEMLSLRVFVAGVVLPAAEMVRRSAVRGPGAVGTAVWPGRRTGHAVPRMRCMASAADARRPEGAVIVRPGIPGGNAAAAVNAPDDVDGHARGGIGVNGPSACGITPDGESGGVVQDGDLTACGHADFSMQMDSPFRNGGGEGQEGEQGAPGAVGKNVVFNRVVFHRLVEQC